MDGEILNIPCTLFKVSTLTTGGHRLTFDAPETAANHVRELIGRENNTNFILCLVKVDDKNTPQNVKVAQKRCPKPEAKTQP